MGVADAMLSSDSDDDKLVRHPNEFKSFNSNLDTSIVNRIIFLAFDFKSRKYKFYTLK